MKNRVAHELHAAAEAGRLDRPPRRLSRRRRRGGFTLLELVVVVAILVALAAIVIPLYDETGSDAQTTATTVSLQCVRDAIAGSAAGPGYVSDIGALPVTLKDLFIMPATALPFDPPTAHGWRGPYLSSPTIPYAVNVFSQFHRAYGQAGDPAPADAWGRPLVLQIPTAALTAADQKTYARLVSAGPDGIIQTPADVLYPDRQRTRRRPGALPFSPGRGPMKTQIVGLHAPGTGGGRWPSWRRCRPSPCGASTPSRTRPATTPRVGGSTTFKQPWPARPTSTTPTALSS